jgi:hypothetical protein
MPDGSTAYEMQTPRHRPQGSRQRSSSQTGAGSSSRQSGNGVSYAEFESDMRRSNTTGNKLGAGLKKRFGSLRRHKDKPVEA